MGYRAHSPPCVVPARPDLSPACRGVGSHPGRAVPMEQKELFLQVTLGCSRACLGLVLALLGHSLQHLLCFPALPWALRGVSCWCCPAAWAHQWLLSPAHSTCNNMFVTGGRQAESHWQPLQSLPLSGGKRPLHAICILLSQQCEIKPCFLSVNIGRPSSSLPEGKQ